MKETVFDFASLLGAAGAFIAASIGRLMWHTEEVQRGNRRFWSIALLWELPACIGMALAGKGLAQYLMLNEWVELGIIATLSYMGPRGIKHLIHLWVLRNVKRKGSSS